MKIKLRVTEDHLINGVRQNCGLCPVALAIGEIVMEDVRIWVLPSSITLLMGYDLHKIWNSIEMGRYISDIDQSVDVEPREFEVEIPEKYLPTVTYES
jgi:hypothetical protein